MSEYVQYLYPLLARFLELKSVYLVHAVDEKSVLTARSRDSIKSSELVPGGVHRRAIAGSSPLTSSVTLTTHNVRVQLLHRFIFHFCRHRKTSSAEDHRRPLRDFPSSISTPVLERWLTPLVELAKRLVSGPPHPEILTRLIEESVSVQLNNVANSEPVRKAWAGGRKNLSVHGLICELETGRLRDLKVTKEAQASKRKGI